jgi:hypothetical protein
MKSFIKKRLLIGFTEPQIAWLEREARRHRTPCSELVRRAVDIFRRQS